MTTLARTEVDRYLERIGLDPDGIRSVDRDVDLLATLQTAHARHVPFENLSIVGDPFGDAPGPGVVLDTPALLEKVVGRGRGGYCYELNGLFTSLLDALGFDVHRAAAMVVPDDGDPSVPANHHVNLVTLDRRYVVDIGMSSPQMHRPTPLDDGVVRDPTVDVGWRVVDNDRPRYDRTVESTHGDGDWTVRYVFDATPRDLSYFRASCDFLASSPTSPFTDGPIVTVDTEDGWLDLREGTFTRVVDGERSEREVSPAAWYELLEEEFGLSVPT